MTRVVVVGGGPAGMAAACRAAESGASVTVLDDNPAVGGQIWRGDSSAAWFQRLHKSGAEFLGGSQVVMADARAKTLLVERAEGFRSLPWDKLVLATGSRELFLPFPGWTLPGVMGAGGMQALVKSGLAVKRKTVVVAGSGPLLLAVASYLKSRGAHVAAIVEQTPFRRLVGLGAGLLASAGKLVQAVQLQLSLAGVPYRTDCWVEAAEGEGQVRRVLVRGAKPIVCDYLAIGYGLTPNTELASVLGCEVNCDGVRVDRRQQTSVADVYCAGESTGIGGVDLSLVEGEIAGLAAVGRPTEGLTGKRRAARLFARALADAFALRPELRKLCRPETLVCRCEDVPYQKLAAHSGWREAKLLTRCGMGPCQGRVCGAAAEFLFGWGHTGVRPPVLPARVGSLVVEEETQQ
jgi:NADPH-dependent 2,4-dienoyl-CoA reductase/sulfur reductase-like enzyme